MKLVGMALSYLTVLIVARKFGAYGAGIYSLSLNLILTVAIFSALGMDVLVLRYSGELHTSKWGRFKLKRIYGNILTVITPASVLLGVILFVSSDFIAENIFKDDIYTEILKVCAFAIPFLTVAIVNIEFLRGFNKLKTSEVLRSVVRPLIVILALFFVIGSDSIISVIYVLVAAIVLSFVLSFLPVSTILYKVKKTVSENVENTRRSVLIKLALPMMIIMVINALLINSGSFFLELFKSSEEVGIFNVAFKLAQLVTLILTVINIVAAPKYAELFWNNKLQELKSFVGLTSKIVFIGCGSLSIVIICFATPLLGLFGEEFVVGRTALIVLIIGQLSYAVTGSVGMFMNMTGNEGAYRNIIVVVFIAVLAGYFVLIPIFDGVLGAAIVFASGSVILNVCSVIYVHKKLKIKTYYLPFLN